MINGNNGYHVSANTLSVRRESGDRTTVTFKTDIK
jgi:hypothetical protein